jgi:hypothetical protein
MHGEVMLYRTNLMKNGQSGGHLSDGLIWPGLFQCVRAGVLKNSAGSTLSTSANFPMISKPTQVTARSILPT